MDMRMQPDISIVMPTLNQGDFIEASMRSVLLQPVQRLELVVADGGSSDSTLSTLARLGGEFPGRVRWISTADSGPAQAVNRAVAMARAPLLGWLNSDDLYTPGAVARALAFFERQPHHVMVYGEGQHIDLYGALIDRYPTRPPSTPVADFRDGCFICQPTAFFRRDAFRALGGLDNELRAAFDFDLWLRFFITHAGRIGFLPEVQALSRLHEGGITLRFRERVAREGISVVSRHLGAAPAHWLLTHFAELCQQHPFNGESFDLRERFISLIESVSGAVDPAAVDELYAHVAEDRRLRFATPDLMATVSADGWAGESFELRLRQPARPWRAIRLGGVNVAGGQLRLECSSPAGALQTFVVAGSGEFVVELLLDDARPGDRLVYSVLCPDTFVPAEREFGSTDMRRLAFRLEHCELML